MVILILYSLTYPATGPKEENAPDAGFKLTFVFIIDSNSKKYKKRAFMSINICLVAGHDSERTKNAINHFSKSFECVKIYLIISKADRCLQK